MGIAASAQSLVTNTALQEQVFAQESAQANQNLPWMIKTLEAAEKEQPVCKLTWYDEAGNRIDVPELIAKLWSSIVSRVPVLTPCCNLFHHIPLSILSSTSIGLLHLPCVCYRYDLYVTEVLIFEGTQYRVQSGIYERLHGQGTCYAAPAFRSSTYLSADEKIYKGKWSPDCAGQYTYATTV